MKEMWKKYKRQIQIGGGICLIAALGIGGYVAANQDTTVQTKVWKGHFEKGSAVWKYILTIQPPPGF